MKLFLSIGIEMAQSNISMDQAKELGLIPYLIYLRIKADQRLADQLDDRKEDNPDLLKFYNSLGNNINHLIKQLSFIVNEEESLKIFRDIDAYLTVDYDLTEYNSTIVVNQLDKVFIAAQNLLPDYENCFINQIAALQSLVTLEKFKADLQSDKLFDSNDIRRFNDVMSHLSWNVVSRKKTTSNLQVA